MRRSGAVARIVGVGVLSVLLALAGPSSGRAQESPDPPADEEERTEQEDDDFVLLPGRLSRPRQLGERINLYWNQGFHLDARYFQLALSGGIQLDGGLLDPNDGVARVFDLPNTYTDGQARRGRVNFIGIFFENHYAKFTYDFAQRTFADILVGVRNLPFAERFQLGNQKEPFSLEEMTGSNDLVFMERALPNALVPGRNTGVRLDGAYFDKRFEFSAGVFANTGGLERFDEAFSNTGDGVNVTFRASGLPLYRDEGRELLHLGFAHSHQFRDGDALRYRSNPESNLAPLLVDTGEIDTDGVHLINPTLAWVSGRFALQSEYVGSFVSRETGDGLTFGGLYVFASYFLTDDYRRFNTTWALFERLVPNREFSWSGSGFGALQVAARFSHLDLNSSDLRAGILNDVTFGVNWFLTQNVRITGNVVLARLRSVGRMAIGQARFQIAF